MQQIRDDCGDIERKKRRDVLLRGAIVTNGIENRRVLWYDCIKQRNNSEAEDGPCLL